MGTSKLSGSSQKNVMKLTENFGDMQNRIVILANQNQLSFFKMSMNEH